jgi:hypothetical protein
MHLYNEEYLLPFWIEHHKNMFDKFIFIDYGCDDNSLNIIKDNILNHQILKTRNEFFSAKEIDDEVMDIESKIDSWKICLNTTEFLITSKNLKTILNNSDNIYKINEYGICEKSNTISNPKTTYEFFQGLKFGTNLNYGYRFIHNLKSDYAYTLGRHYFTSRTKNINNTDDMFLLHCRFYPWNNKFIKRKLQIAGKVSPEDSSHHRWSFEIMEEKANEHRRDSFDLTNNTFIKKCFDYHGY